MTDLRTRLEEFANECDGQGWTSFAIKLRRVLAATAERAEPAAEGASRLESEFAKDGGYVSFGKSIVTLDSSFTAAELRRIADVLDGLGEQPTVADAKG